MWSFFLLTFFLGIYGILGASINLFPSCELVIERNGVESLGSLIAWGRDVNHFYCAVRCPPGRTVSPSIQWFRVYGSRSKPIKVKTNRVHAYNAGMYSRLTFTNFLERDVGLYKCKAWLGGDDGWVEQTVDITYVGASINLFPSCELVIERNGVESLGSLIAWGRDVNHFYCAVRCPPGRTVSPSIQWFRVYGSRSKPIKVKTNRVHAYNAGMYSRLTFTNFLERDVGLYKCKAWLGGDDGWVEQTVDITYVGASINLFPSCELVIERNGVESLGSLIAWGRDVNHFYCAVRCPPGRTVSPSIQWFRVYGSRSKPIKVKTNRVHAYNAGMYSRLTFTNFLERDVGLYKCKAWLGGDDGWVEQTVDITYVGASINLFPSCELVIERNGVESLGSLIAWGRDVNHFYCAVRCPPGRTVSPSIQWFRVYGSRSKPIKVKTNRVHAYNAGMYSRLTFTNFLERDVGLYKCKAWLGGDDGWVEQTVDITYVGASINLFPSCELVIERNGVESLGSLIAWGRDVNHFYCAVRCPPGRTVSPSIQWFRVYGSRSKPIKVKTNRVNAYNAGMYSRLTFTNFLERDVGLYTCKAWLGGDDGWVEQTVDITYGCHGPSFLCDSNRCLPKEAYCNGSRECKDGVDEENCGVCKLTEFKCDDGECVDGKCKCDGYYDCEDNSDEKDCSCSRYKEFTCDDGSCISKNKKCDGTVDCIVDGGSDEDPALCKGDYYDNYGIEDLQDSCESGKFMCDDGECILEEYRCDGYFDCENDTDEKNCDTTTAGPTTPVTEATTTTTPIKAETTTTTPEATTPTTAAPTTPAVTTTLAATSTMAESTTTMEVSTPAMPKTNATTSEAAPSTTMATTTAINNATSAPECDEDAFFKCADSSDCIPIDWYCDSYEDCEDSSDEMNCPTVDGCLTSEFNCGEGMCIPQSAVCDDNMDCPRNEDEEACTGCTNDEFKCGNDMCIPAIARCDSFPHCEDGSDEAWCFTGLYCPENMIACQDQTKCYNSDERCNGQPDCADGSDEASCMTATDTGATATDTGANLIVKEEVDEEFYEY